MAASLQATLHRELAILWESLDDHSRPLRLPLSPEMEVSGFDIKVTPTDGPAPNTDTVPPIIQHGRGVKGVGHLGHIEATKAGGREFDPRPGHYSRMRF